MKPKHLVLWVLISLATTVALAYVARWWTAIAGSIVLLGGLVGFTLLLITLLAWGLAKIRKTTVHNLKNKSLLLAGFFLLLQLTYDPISQVLRQWEITRAQAFAEALMPRIEAYKEQHATYPITLEVVLSRDDKLPALLELQGDLPMPYNNQDFYFLRGSSYGFRFYLPDGFIGYSYEYCCGPSGRWTVTD